MIFKVKLSTENFLKALGVCNGKFCSALNFVTDDDDNVVDGDDEANGKYAKSQAAS